MQPLDGIRILDLTSLLPGPWCTMLLGDLGADVLKVENAKQGGDTARQAHPRYVNGGTSESIYFCNVNRNKGSVLLDLTKSEHRERFHDLVERADVVVESFRPGVADRLGVGYEACRARNPQIVYCAITGYGQRGPRRDLGGHDLNVAGMSGLLQVDASRPPEMPNVLMGDYAGATTAVIAIVSALLGRSLHGRGAFLNISMLEALMSWTNVQITGVFSRVTGSTGAGAVEGWGGNPRYGIYRTRDGKYVTVSLLEKKFWDKFCRIVSREDLINDAETEADRLTTHGERGPLYRRFLEEFFLQRDRDVLAEKFRAHNIPICPVLTLDEVFCARTGGKEPWFIELELPHLNARVPQVGFPFQMTSSDGVHGFEVRRPPPRVGDPNGLDWPGLGSLKADCRHA